MAGVRPTGDAFMLSVSGQEPVSWSLTFVFMAEDDDLDGTCAAVAGLTVVDGPIAMVDDPLFFRLTSADVPSDVSKLPSWMEEAAKTTFTILLQHAPR